MCRFLWCALVAVLPAAVASVDSANSATCQVISTQFPGRVITRGASAYDSAQGSYYSGQERELMPDCIFMPATAAEVSQFVKVVTGRQGRDARFAIRSGGHTLWGGAANIDGGITVDMRLMNETSLSADRKTVGLGSGGRFHDVYHQLSPHNLTVMGGRVPSIGVGGFLSTGEFQPLTYQTTRYCGMTFMSRRHGFACDSIYGYEIVLASGEIAYVTQASHPDLWLALKGGGNNLGIITRFDVPAFPSDRMWYSLLEYEYKDSVLRAQAQAFSHFMEPARYDPDAMMGIFLNYAHGNFSIQDALWHTNNLASPPVYQEFTKIPNLRGTAELATVADVVDKFGANIPPTASRAFQLDWSFKNAPADVYLEVFRAWERGVVQRLADVEGLACEFLLQPQSVTNGTNAYGYGHGGGGGLEPGRTDYAMMLLTATYGRARDDARVRAAVTAMADEQRAVLGRRGYLVDFVYPNYADASQDPYKTWGAASLAKLQAASRKYDPQGVFQKRVPGGFKVFR
ncbi:FAD-binding domain-containing protein [Apiospora sp. TS-2023a]